MPSTPHSAPERCDPIFPLAEARSIPDRAAGFARERRLSAGGLVRQKLPNFFGSKRQNRRHQVYENLENGIQGGLRRASGFRRCAFAIKTVFDDVQILRAQVDAAEIVERVIDNVEFVIIISLPTATEHGLCAL